MSKHISRFNPQRMSEDDVLNLATGRDNLLKLMVDDMQTCMHPNSNQHFILYGPRGIGKSFFTRLLKITHDRSRDFNNSIFIQLPEEQSNLSFVADLLDMLAAKLEGKLFSSLTNRWEISDAEWQKSKKRLTTAIEQLKKKGISHVFFTMENLQDFIPKLDSQESGRMREVLSDFSNLTLIGSSLHPDLDSDYNKKLFQVFKKIDLKPWGEKDYITYYRKKASLNNSAVFDEEKAKLSENRIRAIAHFTGGSPRLAVILNSLILNDDIISTLEIMNGIIDELTPYYQDLTKDIPPRSKLLFDLLIRLGENITQSQLAAGLQPAQEQKTIARSFSWLTDNYYVNAIKQKAANVKHYYVRDRLYVLYYQNREVMADQQYSFVETFVEFLTQFYNQQELKTHLQKIDDQHFLSKELLFAYTKRVGIDLDESCSLKQLKEAIANHQDANVDWSLINNLATDKKFLPAIKELRKIKDHISEPEYWSSLGYLYSMNQNNVESIKNFKKALKLDINNSDYYYAIASEYGVLNNTKLAIINYEKCLKIDPLRFDVLYFLGGLYGKNKDYKKSKKYYLEYYKIYPSDFDVNLELGAVSYILKDNFEAIKFYSNAIKIDSKVWDVHFNLGVILNRNNQHEQAIKSFKESIKLNPKKSIIYPILANSYFKLGKIEEAEQNLLYSLKLDPKHENFITNLLAFYLSIYEFKKLKVFLESNIEYQKIGIKIGSISSELLFGKRSDNFYKIMKVITWLQTDNIDWLLPFISTLTSSLYARKDYDLISDVIDELNNTDNASLKTLIQAWHYILDPENGDFAALHPDARIAVEAVLGVKQ